MRENNRLRPVVPARRTRFPPYVRFLGESCTRAGSGAAAAVPGSGPRRFGARGRVRHFGPELSIFDELNTPYIAEINATATKPTIRPMQMMTAGSNSDVSFFSLYSSSRP